MLAVILVGCMEMLGQCMLCGKPTHHTCSICGRLVCPDHYYPRARMCSRCIPVNERKHGPHGDRDGPGLLS